MSILDRIFGIERRARGRAREVDPFANLTWRCDICRDARPDEKISVYKVDIGPKDQPGIAIRNVKYCNDRPACRTGAQDWQERR